MPPVIIRIGQLIRPNSEFNRMDVENIRVEGVGVDWTVARGVETGKLYFSDVEPKYIIRHCIDPEEKQ